jgi:hypothetical protein
MGWQHYVLPSVYIRERAVFEELLERDKQKALQVWADGRYKFLIVREDEPYADPNPLRRRLIAEGILV